MIVTSKKNFFQPLIEILADQHYRKRMAHFELQEQQSVPSLLDCSVKQALRQLKQAIECEHASASFACGGSISIIGTESGDENPGTPRHPPVHIFWMSPSGSQARSLVLPSSHISDLTHQGLQELVKDCRSATLGKELDDAIDTNCWGMDRAHFATNFDLARCGIVDRVEQILLQVASGSKKSELQFHKLRAELESLHVSGCLDSNVYCAADK